MRNALVLAALTLAVSAEAAAQRRQEPDPRNRADFERYREELRARMPKPRIQDPELRRVFDEYWRDAGRIGNGSTADAARYERWLGKQTGEHIEKGGNYLKGFERWLRNNPGAPRGDGRIIENEVEALYKALYDPPSLPRAFRLPRGARGGGRALGRALRVAGPVVAAALFALDYSDGMTFEEFLTDHASYWAGGAIALGVAALLPFSAPVLVVAAAGVAIGYGISKLVGWWFNRGKDDPKTPRPRRGRPGRRGGGNDDFEGAASVIEREGRVDNGTK